MVEHPWTLKLAVSAVLGFLSTQWFDQPKSIRALLIIIGAHLLLGGLRAHLDPLDKFSGWKLWQGLLRRGAALFCMVMATRAAQGNMPEGFPDVLLYFTNVAIGFEFIGCIKNYVSLGGPGAPGMRKLSDQLRDYYLTRQPLPLDQEQISAKLEAQKQAGQNS